MKRTLSIVLAMIMLLSSICVSAEDGEFNLEEIKVEYSIGAEQSNNIEVKGTYNKSLVLRVFNENNELEYIGTISSNENTFEFKPFQLKKPQLTGKTGTTTKEGNNDITKYAFEYRFVISDENGILNKDNEAVAFEYSTIKTNNTSSGGLGGRTDPVPDPVPPWDPKPNPTDVTTDTTTDTADKDPLDKGGSNKPLWDKVNKVTSSSGAASAIDAITNKTDKEELKGETARNNVAVAVETMTANIGAKSMSVSPKNELILSSNSVGDRDMAKWSEASDTIASP